MIWVNFVLYCAMYKEILLIFFSSSSSKDPSTNSNVGTTIPREISTVYVVNTITEGMRSEVTESITTVKPDVSKPV